MQLREWIWHNLIRSTQGVWPASLRCHETETELTPALQFHKELKVFVLKTKARNYKGRQTFFFANATTCPLWTSCSPLPVVAEM
jgi:hypothetical protein